MTQQRFLMKFNDRLRDWHLFLLRGIKPFQPKRYPHYVGSLRNIALKTSDYILEFGTFANLNYSKDNHTRR